MEMNIMIYQQEIVFDKSLEVESCSGSRFCVCLLLRRVPNLLILLPSNSMELSDGKFRFFSKNLEENPTNGKIY